MSWYHSISPHRINDPRVRRCKPLARVVWGVLLAGELATKVPGLSQGGRLTVAEVLEVEPADAGEALDELVAVGVVEVDPATRLIRLLGVAEDYRRLGASSKTAKHWIRRCWELPVCPLLGRQAVELREVATPEVAGEWEALICACGETPPALSSPAKGAPKALEAAARPKRKASRKPRRENPALRALRATLETAQAILVKGRADLGFDEDPEPITPAVLKLAEESPPEIIDRLPLMAKRSIERRRREYQRGDDYRRFLTLSAVIRQADQFFNAKDLDGPPSGARGPPAPGFIEGPTTF